MAIKAMGIFGGVQALNILCSVVRTKLVAWLMGSVGVGLFGLYNNALEMIVTITNLNVRSSSVRDISQKHESGDASLVARIIAVVRRWSLWLGLGGATLTMALAPALSHFTFGDSNHIWGFVALSAAVLLVALTNGEQAVLQGTQRLRRLASASMWGTLCGLLVSVPMFYWWRERSVLPSIIAYAACNAIAVYVLRNRDYPAVSVTRRETTAVGAAFVRLGIYMTIGGFATSLASYVFNAWLNHHAGTGEVGFYQAGYTLINRYTGLLFTALGMEYYPRLARVADSPKRLRIFVSQEINIAMMVLAPVAATFILFRSQIVWLLYTEEFKVILTYISIGMVGMTFRALSWCMAFVILARGDGKTYVMTESLSAVAGLVLNIVCYTHWGITGLGLAFTLWYIFYTLVVAWVYYRRYHLSLSRGTLVGILSTLAVTSAMAATQEHNLLWLAVTITAITVIVSLVALKKAWR